MLTRWQARGRVAVLVAAVVLLAVQTPLLAVRHDVVVGVALLLALVHVIGAPLALWRPIPAAGLSLLASTAQALVIMPQGVIGWPWAIAPQIITQLLILLILTIVAGWWIAAGTLVAQLVIGVILALIGSAWNDFAASLGYVALFAGLALLFGSLGVISGRLVEIRGALRRERKISAEEYARRTVIEDKSRIARELHDVIAHNMSLITVQARSAPERIGDVGESAEAEFDQIADRAADALRQMRGVLDVLRTEPGQSGRDPVPGIDDLPELFESARATGQDVVVEGSPPTAETLATEVGSAAYRIIQEALSNARRHAPEAPVRVMLSVDASQFEVRVVNAVDQDLGVAEGHGVLGMRERANAVGGRVNIGASTPGEFSVDARFPVLQAPDEAQ